MGEAWLLDNQWFPHLVEMIASSHVDDNSTRAWRATCLAVRRRIPEVDPLYHMVITAPIWPNEYWSAQDESFEPARWTYMTSDIRPPLEAFRSVPRGPFLSFRVHNTDISSIASYFRQLRVISFKFQGGYMSTAGRDPAWEIAKDMKSTFQDHLINVTTIRFLAPLCHLKCSMLIESLQLLFRIQTVIGSVNFIGDGTSALPIIFPGTRRWVAHCPLHSDDNWEHGGWIGKLLRFRPFHPTPGGACGGFTFYGPARPLEKAVLILTTHDHPAPADHRLYRGFHRPTPEPADREFPELGILRVFINSLARFVKQESCWGLQCSIVGVEEAAMAFPAAFCHRTDTIQQAKQRLEHQLQTGEKHNDDQAESFVRGVSFLSVAEYRASICEEQFRPETGRCDFRFDDPLECQCTSVSRLSQ